MKPSSILFLFLFTGGVSIGQNINDGLLLDYSFNETTEDQSGNNYDGNPFGMSYTADRFGNPNSAAFFDGFNDYVNFPNLEALKPELPVSFSFWIKYTSASNQDRAVFNTSFEEDVNTGVVLTSGAATNQYAVGFGNGSPFYSTGSIENYVSLGTVETNEWTHISIVVSSASDMQIYINCVELGGYYGGSGGSLVYSNLPGCIGRHDQTTNQPAFYFKGAIDDFKYWSRVLTAEEIGILCVADETICAETLTTQDNEGCVTTDLIYDFEFSGELNNLAEVLWTFSDGSTSNSQSPTKSYTTTGSFPFSLQITMDNGCIYESEGNTIIIEVPNSPVLPESISICAGESYLLDLSDFSDWDQVLDPNGNPVTSFTFDEPGIFNFEFIHACGQAEIVIEVYIVTATGLELEGQTEITVCPDQPKSPDLTVNLSGNTYLWDPPTGLSDPTVLNPQITASQPITYLLTATNPCAAGTTFELSVIMADPIDFELLPELTICAGDTIEIPGQLNSEAIVEWTNSNTLSATNIPNPLTFPGSTTTYQVSVSDQCQSMEHSIQIIVNEPPHISGISNLDICVGDTAYANIHNTGNYEVTSWYWTPTIGLDNATTANPGIFNENDATYQVNASNSCGSDLLTVQLKTYHLEAILDLDSIVCPGTPISLSANGAASYLWFPVNVIDSPHDSATVAHIYTDQLIQLQLSGGTCVKTFSNYVQVYENIGFTQLDAVHLFAGEYYDLSNIESQYNIVFSGSAFLSFDADTTISLSYVDYNGCEFHLFLPIIIAPALYIPNGFTPDGDGKNDIFKPIGVNIENFKMRIYSRLGKLIFQSNSLSNGWNGGLNGYYCPDDIYNYVIEYSYHTTEVQVQRGFVTLLR